MPDNSPVLIRVAGHGRFLATRSTGAHIREQAEREPGVIVLDFGEVEAMTVSFGDELAGKLLAAGRDVRVRNASEDIRETLELVCRRRDVTCPAPEDSDEHFGVHSEN